MVMKTGSSLPRSSKVHLAIFRTHSQTNSGSLYQLPKVWYQQSWMEPRWGSIADKAVKPIWQELEGHWGVSAWTQPQPDQKPFLWKDYSPKQKETLISEHKYELSFAYSFMINL